MHGPDRLLSAAVSGLTGLLAAQAPQTGPPVQAPEPTAIVEAVKAGIAHLRRAQTDGHWRYERTPSEFHRRRASDWPATEDYSGGLTALALYAMAATGAATTDPAIERGLEWCRAHPRPFAEGRRGTYAASLLVLALCRIDPVAHRKWIHELAGRLAESQLKTGMWTYELTADGARSDKPDRPRFPWLSTGDGSNTQFAVLALWSAQLTAQFRTPQRVWQRVRSLYESTQLDDGGWSYKLRSRRSGPRPPATGRTPAPVWMFDSSPAMTAAGTFAYTCATAGLAGGARGLPKARKSKVAQKGLDVFLDSRSRWSSLLDDEYFAYSIERVATLFALPDADWYPVLARHLLGSQKSDGRWGQRYGRSGAAAHGDRQQVYQTSLALLCLSRASSHPITPRRK